jgi:hypothetical protein
MEQKRNENGTKTERPHGKMNQKENVKQNMSARKEGRKNERSYGKEIQQKVVSLVWKSSDCRGADVTTGA